MPRDSADESPDWRALFGFSSCQGIGTYQHPIPRKIAPQVEQPVEEGVEKKVLKVRTLTPLAPKKKIIEPDKPSSKYEIPVGDQAEVVTLTPVSEVPVVGTVLSDGAAISPATTAPLEISSGIPLLQVAPEMGGTVATALALPLNDAKTLSRSTRFYKINDVVKTDDNQTIGKKIVEDPRYAAQFYSITETPTNFTAVFFHKYEKPLDVWIEGAGKGRVQLSKSKAAPNEEITLTIDKVDGKIPYFKLHVGELSEVFEFFPLRKSVKLGKIEIKIKPVVGDVASNLTTPAAPEVGTGAATAGALATPSAGVVAVAPAPTSAADLASVIDGAEASAPAAATMMASPTGSTAPKAVISSATTSISTVPVVGSVAALTAPVAPEVGTAAVTAIPSAGATTSAPASASVIAGTKESTSATASVSTAVSTASVVGGVTGLTAPVAPQVGIVAATTGAAIPSAGGAAIASATTSTPASASMIAGAKRELPPL